MPTNKAKDVNEKVVELLDFFKRHLCHNDTNYNIRKYLTPTFFATETLHCRKNFALPQKLCIARNFAMPQKLCIARKFALQQKLCIATETALPQKLCNIGSNVRVNDVTKNVVVHLLACLLAMPCWQGLKRPKQLSMAASNQAHYFLW